MSEKPVLKTDIAVIGGGAGGLMAAISAGESSLAKGCFCSVAVLEKQDRVARKLLATGNGRCNLTNRMVSGENYHGNHRDFPLASLKAFDVKATRDFFAKIGVETVEEDGGRIFPVSGQSATVLDMLRRRLEFLGITIKTHCEVKAIAPIENGFELTTSQGKVTAKKVIVATGSGAAPKLGGNTGGYGLLQQLGLVKTPVYPGLVPLKTENEITKSLKGQKFYGSVNLRLRNKVLCSAEGEILFTDYGLSGLPIMAVSSGVLGRDNLEIDLDFFPSLSEDELKNIILKRRDNLGYLFLEDFLSGIMVKKIGQLMLKYLLGVKLSRSVESLTDKEITVLVKGLKVFTLKVRGTVGFERGQIAVGGIDTADFDPNTLESSLVPGLYAVGEVLDVNGDCGGYNLQWAWSSGYVAGESCVDRLIKEFSHDKN